MHEGTDLIGFLGLEGNYTFVSDSTTRILGIYPEEFIGRNAVKFIHPEDQENILQQFPSLETISQFKLPPLSVQE